ncbi:MAG TPA: beta-galactosidase [Candidatus Coprenecus stercoravium]|uniref:mannan endo-1,4-beta-mannosidase n=1 Tax=Candidatus Coprenecus stercoravium TaxID=2840735 RepID=A0A9D2GPP3_9BACT|nr:beta-galactosidase [Candidatus Coprenecus stercoravium]
MRTAVSVLSAMAAVLIFSCVGGTGSDIIKIENGQFIKHGEPYYFVGTNFWYGPILASEGTGGDRERLARELDSLCAIGVRNLRVLVGSDGDRGVYTKVEPTLQYAPGKYNDTLLRGLDYFLVELGKRDMEAVLYLNNAWEWSGGYSQYLKWAGYGDIPLPRVASYNEYVDYVSNFIKSDSAKNMFRRYVMDIVSRTNTVTGKAYRDDPAIFSWQISNEPRPFGADNKEAFKEWIVSTAEIIKAIDPNHMVSVGSEGKYGCEVDLGLWEEIGRSSYIDYLNIHIWPFNWGWTSREDMNTGNVAPAVELSNEYLEEHMAVADRLHKPLVVEEFGFPRDSVAFSRSSSVSMRDVYYEAMLSHMTGKKEEGSLLAGFNFWGWAGVAVPSGEHLMWQPGDDYTGDPAQEEQGLYSVFASDTSTVRIIKKYALQ